MKKIPLRRLNASGLAHFVLPLLIIVAMGLTGTYMVVSSNANSGDPCASANALAQQDPANQLRIESAQRCRTANIKHYCSQAGQVVAADGKSCRASVPRKTYPPCVGSDNAFLNCVNNKPPEKRKSAEKKRVNKIGQESVADGGTQSAKDIAPKHQSKQPPIQAIQVNNVVPPALAEYVKPTGNVTIVTYLDNPATAKTNDSRLGNVNVTLERIGAQLKCANRKTSAAKTNGVKYRKGTQILVKGTVHFLNCEVGQYKATLVGRANYQAATGVNANIQSFTLSKNETQVISFVLEKGSTGP